MADTIVNLGMDKGKCVVSMPDNELYKVKVFGTKDRQNFVLRQPELTSCTVNMGIGDVMLVDVYGYDGEGVYAHLRYGLSEQGLVMLPNSHYVERGVKVVIQESEE
jgi:hypothetical protein